MAPKPKSIPRHERAKHDASHRVIAPGGTPGAWAPYTFPATVVEKGIKYVAFTEYWDGEFDKHVVYAMVPMPTKAVLVNRPRPKEIKLA